MEFVWECELEGFHQDHGISSRNIHFNVGNIRQIPLAIPSERDRRSVTDGVRKMIELARIDWDSPKLPGISIGQCFSNLTQRICRYLVSGL